MLKIRLQRFGKNRRPTYKIVMAQCRSKRDGKYLENLGHYDPFNKIFSANIKKIIKHIKCGASTSATLKNLLYAFYKI